MWSFKRLWGCAGFRVFRVEVLGSWGLGLREEICPPACRLGLAVGEAWGWLRLVQSLQSIYGSHVDLLSPQPSPEWSGFKGTWTFPKLLFRHGSTHVFLRHKILGSNSFPTGRYMLVHACSVEFSHALPAAETERGVQDEWKASSLPNCPQPQ